jgi:hypothetical protein
VLLVFWLKRPHVVEDGGRDVRVLHRVEVVARVEREEALKVRDEAA